MGKVRNGFIRPNLGGTATAKLNANGTQLLYSTYLGRRNDLAESVAVDQSGNAYIAGSTNLIDFPTANPFQAANGGVIAAVALVGNPYYPLTHAKP